MSAAAPVTFGTGIYILVTGLVVILTWGLKMTNSISKNSAQIISVVTITGGIFAWLLWLCAWMHQWHPLMNPEWKGPE